MTNAQEMNIDRVKSPRHWFVSALIALSLTACGSNGAPSDPLASAGSAGSSGAPASGGRPSETGGGGGTSAGTGGGGGTSAGTGGGGGTSAATGGRGGTSAGTGGGVSGGAAGFGGSISDYNPCPAAGTPCKVMPLGDSITAGAGSANLGSYREPLFHLTLTHNQDITFVGSLEYGPNTVDGVPFPRHCEGHGGFTIDDGGGRWGITSLTPPSITTFTPHIITLMIGTNDVDIQLDLANAPARLGAVLDSVAKTDPKILLVVATITPTTDDTENVRVQQFNAAIPALVKTRATAGQHIVMVDMYAAFTRNSNYKTEYMYDKLHPREAGYAVMADVWYQALGGLFR